MLLSSPVGRVARSLFALQRSGLSCWKCRRSVTSMGRMRNGSWLKLSGFSFRGRPGVPETRDGWPSENNTLFTVAPTVRFAHSEPPHVNPPSRARDRKEGREGLISIVLSLARKVAGDRQGACVDRSEP
jgi:hypothetical protein